MTEQEVQGQFQQQFAALAHKHASVSYALIAVLVFVLAAAGFGGWLGLKYVDKLEARAEKQEQQYDADRKAWQDKTAADQAQRDADTKQQQLIVKVVHDRDTSTDTAIGNVTAPGKTAQQAATDVQKTYNLPDAPQVSGDSISFTVPQVQTFSATKLDRDRLSLDLGDTKKQLSLEQDKTKTLTTDLSGCKTTLGEAQTTINTWKTVAKVSRWKKVLHYAETGAAVGVSIVAGYEIGKRL